MCPGDEDDDNDDDGGDDDDGDELYKTRMTFGKLPERPERWSFFGVVKVNLQDPHCHQWFFNGFGSIKQSPSNVFSSSGILTIHISGLQWFLGCSTIGPTVFNGEGPLVQRCNGFNGSLRSTLPDIKL